MGCTLVTAKADVEKEGLEDVHEYVNSLSPTVPHKEVQEVKSKEVAEPEVQFEEVWEWGSKSGFRWSDRELRGIVRRVAILETIWEDSAE